MRGMRSLTMKMRHCGSRAIGPVITVSVRTAANMPGPTAEMGTADMAAHVSATTVAAAAVTAFRESKATQ